MIGLGERRAALLASKRGCHGLTGAKRRQAVLPGDAYAYVGSSAWIALTAQQPVYDPQMRTFTLAHLDPKLYMPLGSMQCAGGSFDWLEGLLRGDKATRLHDDLSMAAAAVPPGAAGLLFLPHLMGERSPYWNPLARGAFVGHRHSRRRGRVFAPYHCAPK